MCTCVLSSATSSCYLQHNSGSSVVDVSGQEFLSQFGAGWCVDDGEQSVLSIIAVYVLDVGPPRHPGAVPEPTF